MEHTQALILAKASSWLGRQSSTFQDALLGRCRLLRFRKGEYIYHLGDPASEVFFLASGVVLLAVAHPVVGLVNGQVVQPGRWFGEAAGLSQKNRLVSVEVRRPSHVLAFSTVVLFQLVQENPDHAAALLDLMADASEDYQMHALDLLIQAPRPRLFSRLLTFCGRRLYQMPPQEAVVPLSQDELALASGLSRQTINQILHELVDAGIVALRYREIQVLDTQALAALVR